MAMYGTPILVVFERYVFNDWEFLFSLALLFLLDTIVGSIAAIIEGSFKPTYGVKRFCLKLLGYMMTIICIGIMDNALIAGKSNWLEGVVDAAAFAVMIAFEGSSVLKNIYRIYPFEQIKFLLKKLEIYYNKQQDKVENQ